MERLQQKSLNQQFINRLIQGLHCSPFEASAILDTVYQVIGPYIHSTEQQDLGQIHLLDFRSRGIVLPVRSTIKDMGRGISHRSLIIRHWLAGKEYEEISNATHHSPRAVANYVSQFTRAIWQGLEVHTIGFLVGLSPKLTSHYFTLCASCPNDGQRTGHSKPNPGNVDTRHSRPGNSSYSARSLPAGSPLIHARHYPALLAAHLHAIKMAKRL